MENREKEDEMSASVVAIRRTDDEQRWSVAVKSNVFGPSWNARGSILENGTEKMKEVSKGYRTVVSVRQNDRRNSGRRWARAAALGFHLERELSSDCWIDEQMAKAKRVLPFWDC
ncbi:hypothetical protein GQ457_10G000710 [Hibiscus cannabinus]